MKSLPATLILLAATFTAQAAAKQPNILFLVADEYRADCLSAAGHPVVKTPSFDKLAHDGVRFSQAVSASPVCSPARACFFTGRYPQINGVRTNGVPFKDGEVMLPEILRARGYHTALIGKIHLIGYLDWFDVSHMSSGGNSKEYKDWLASKGRTIQGGSNTAAVEGSLVKPSETSLRVGTSVLPEELYEEAWLADLAIADIRAQNAAGKPWFVFLSMLKPHSEYVVPAPYDKMYDPATLPLPKTFIPGADVKDDRKDLDGEPRANAKGKVRKSQEEGRHVISDEELLRQVIAHYYGAVTMVDKQMGRVIAAIDELGLANDTIIVFTSDHGNMLGERNRMFKGVMYEGSLRVPLLWRAPGRIPAGKVTDAFVDTASVMPTLLDLAGLPIPAGVQGVSLAPMMRGDASGGAPEAAYSYLADQMVRQGEWKLIVPASRKAPSELYRVAVDPDEQHNLFGKPEAAEAQARLTALMEKWMAQKPPKVELPK